MRDVHLALLSQSLCCDVRRGAFIFTLYYLVSTLMVCVGMAVSAFNGKELTGTVHDVHMTRGQKIFDTSSIFMLVIMMAISCVVALIGLRKGYYRFLLPFIVQLYLDLVLSVLSLFSDLWGLPGTPTFEENMTFFTAGKAQDPKTVAQMAMIFGVLFVVYLLIKAYTAHVLTKCYYLMKLTGEMEVSPKEEKSVAVKLPSYDEAVKIPAEMPSPAYESK